MKERPGGGREGRKGERRVERKGEDGITRRLPPGEAKEGAENA